jgi:hypothetical protein
LEKSVLKRITLGGFAFALGLAPIISLPAAGQQKSSEQASPAAHPAPSQMPDDYKLNMLIRTTIIAVNQANMTGNYSVLRDLGTPAFQVANNPSALSDAFAALRRRKLDLSPILFFEPKLVARPAIRENGVLHLAGFLETTPEQVNFELAFQTIDGQWLLDSIAVGMSRPAPAKSGWKTSSSQAPSASGK